MVANSSSTSAVTAMYEATEIIESHVESIVKVAFPQEYQNMKHLWSAAKWNKRDTGCHIARAVVFKLPVLPHWDDTDYGVSVSFAAGKFTRGYLYIPQFDLVFE